MYKPGLQGKIEKFWRDTGVSLQNTLSEIWTNSEWAQEGMEKAPYLWWEMKQ